VRSVGLRNRRDCAVVVRSCGRLLVRPGVSHYSMIDDPMIVNDSATLLGRLTYLSANLCFMTDSFFFLSFLRRLISELAEQNSTKIGQMLGSNCDLKTRVENPGYSLPTNQGSKNHLFPTTSQLNSNFNGLYLWNET